ncbi:MAG: hypothetical protein Q8K65_10085 [Alphaproteobacteria bacterium]|nr:hypothetical protein [Alphaproteobacteria bacterium]
MNGKNITSLYVLCQSSQLPIMRAMEDTAASKFFKVLVLMRGAEADAFSFELAMLAALKKIGAIEGIEEGLLSPYNAQHPTNVEKRDYIQSFFKKHGDNPFSPTARKDAFDFAQTSDFFKSSYDNDYAAFDAPKRIARTDLTQAFRKITKSAASTDSASYLSESEIKGIDKFTLQNLAPTLQSQLGYRAKARRLCG